jgi:hypothetical protein
MLVNEFIKQHGLEKLQKDYGIIVKDYPEEQLYILNYDQIESPTYDPLIKECRSLILDYNFNIVSRSFNRFFNYGEHSSSSDFDIKKCFFYEKVDGSLIKLYKYKGKWNISTKGTAFAESNTPFGHTFKEMVWEALNVSTEENFQFLCNAHLNPFLTHNFEVVGVANRVVKRYNETALYYLASTDTDGDCSIQNLQHFPCRLPEHYKFDTIQHCLDVVKGLKDLDEGFVVYQEVENTINSIIPVAKIKSPVYVAVHRIKGEGLTPKRIMQLVLINEQSEYLTYFPEDEVHFTPYINAFQKLEIGMEIVYNANKHIEDQKEFALAVKKYCFSGVLFQARKTGENVLHTFNTQRESTKLAILQNFKENI